MTIEPAVNTTSYLDARLVDGARLNDTAVAVQTERRRRQDKRLWITVDDTELQA